MASAQTIAYLLNIAQRGLSDIGYHNNLLREDYQFADILSQNELQQIELAAFAQEPPSYLNSCIGIAAPLQDDPEAIMKYRALGAPQILALHPEGEKILRWKMLAHGKPELIETIDFSYLYEAIVSHEDDWKPEEVLRAKSIRFTGEPIQLDFFDLGLIPAIEEIVHMKLDILLRDVLATCKALYQEHYETNLNEEALFRLVFRLIAAKLLGDRQHSQKWLNYNVQEVLSEVEKFYFSYTPHQAVLDNILVQNAAWRKIRTAFSFQNLSVEALAYIYENTLVTRETRKKQSIHATSHALADYIVQQLPIKDLPDEERSVFEPFAGHAPFLIAALGRLRTLLPAEASAEQRHNYFTRMLTGMESEAFACEVAGNSLILADYPNPNGWQIEKDDVFTSPKLDDYLAKANIVLCNPPYESFTREERLFYSPIVSSSNKAVEALNRVLQHPPKMLGLLLPRTFIDGQIYAKVRKKIAERYNHISLISLPDNAFNFSRVEAILLLAYGEHTTQPVWKFASVNREGYKNFTSVGEPTWQVQAPISFIEKQISKDNFELWYTPIHHIWDALANLPRMKDIAYIQRGIEYNIPFAQNEKKLVSDRPEAGFVKGLRGVPKDFEPYIIRNFVYLNMYPQNMLYEAYKLPWNEPKVIVNAVRIHSDRWLIAGIVDRQGLVCYQNFHGVWPTSDMPLEVISALLNSPIANAFLSSHRATWHNRKEIINQIPVPVLDRLQVHRIVSLVQEYMSYKQEWLAQPDNAAYFERRCKGIVRQIDSELLTAYDLSPHFEQDLCQYFDGYSRPGLASLTTLKPSSAKRLYTSLIRIENIRNEDHFEGIDAVIMNWDPYQTVPIPTLLIPAEIRKHLHPETRLLAQVNVGANKAEDLIFEDFRLAPEPKLYDAQS